MKNILASSLLFLGLASAIGRNNVIGMKKLNHRKQAALHDWDSPSTWYPSFNLSVPVDHFHNDSKYEPHSNEKFNLRYWFDATHYKPGGPVILFESGEADANSRMPILYKGIVHLLAVATGGMGVIIEHRYYGTSQPFPNLETENLRFLSTDQAMADNVWFSQNVVFQGLEHMDLTSHTVPWILYGGSYSGAFVAISRKLYPETWWGAISSSGVVEAIWDYWDYFEPIRNHAPQECVKMTQFMTNAMDNIFIKNKSFGPMLKKAFNMSTISHDDDFSLTLAEFSIGDWQDTNWDPKVNFDGFQQYCAAVTSDKLTDPKMASMTSTVRELLHAGGYGDPLSLQTLVTPMLNWISFAQVQIVDICPAPSLDDCFNTHGPKPYADKSLPNNADVSWPYQFCTQWGFLQTGSGAPEGQLSLISRLVTLDYSAIICREAFNITVPADVNAINKYGGNQISYPRLAIIDGIADPWRGATPHASSLRPFTRNSTMDEPFYLIPDGSVHHWDENGLRPHGFKDELPPANIRNVQAFEIKFVKKWMADWHAEQKAKRAAAKLVS